MAFPGSDSERTELGSAPRAVPATPAPSKPLPGRSRSGAVSSLMHPKNRLSPRFTISTKAGSCGERLKAPFPPAKHSGVLTPRFGNAGFGTSSLREEQVPLPRGRPSSGCKNQEPGAEGFHSLPLSRLHQQLVGRARSAAKEPERVPRHNWDKTHKIRRPLVIWGTRRHNGSTGRAIRGAGTADMVLGREG